MLCVVVIFEELHREKALFLKCTTFDCAQPENPKRFILVWKKPYIKYLEYSLIGSRNNCSL